ncbi:MAG: TIGR02186 family protein [Hyphomicrobiaceae bacterium]
MMTNMRFFNAAISFAFAVMVLGVIQQPGPAHAQTPAAPDANAAATGQMAGEAQPTLADDETPEPLLQDGRPKEAVETDISTRSVAVTSSFDGTEIIVFGTVEHSRQKTPESGYYDVAVVIDGTPTPIIARRKGHVAGIWINTDSVLFEQVPSYYAITSTRPINEIATPEVLDKNAIGFDSVHMKVRSDQPQWTPEELAEFRSAVIRLKQKDQLYQKSDYGVAFIGRSLFRSTISLPANVPVGPLVVHTYLFKDGELLSKHSNPVKLQREGLERYLHMLAFDYPMFYGIFAVFLAVVAGLLASAVFKRGSH